MRDDYEFNVELCSLIESHPVLYDFNVPEYCNKNVQDHVWELIGRTLKESVKECKGRWANIRNRYGKCNKLKLLPSDSDSKPIKEYYLAAHLKFLDPFMKPRKSKSKRSTSDPIYVVPEYNDADETGTLSPKMESPPSSPSADSSNKCTTPSFKDVNESAYSTYYASKRVKPDEDKQPELDTDLSFLQSMLPDMNAMNPAQKRRFKIGVMQLATEILDEEETPSSNDASSTKYQRYRKVATPRTYRAK